MFVVWRRNFHISYFCGGWLHALTEWIYITFSFQFFTHTLICVLLVEISLMNMLAVYPGAVLLRLKASSIYYRGLPQFSPPPQYGESKISVEQLYIPYWNATALLCLLYLSTLFTVIMLAGRANVSSIFIFCDKAVFNSHFSAAIF